ncbi:putative spermidine/putrescine transport system permease protein [Halohasta litchfieldiae]|jgi:putative spermidine/putrescine transport system permease protein|uniref:Putative spermidine/putrescine transport system permease protein n=1 Tax=Halohasta litchfieldiae TaxID=1073996 RepID=A0A1H6X000_9EURY|nr:ABC transporter permease subunit [Halohasta litchfieldiae]ATW89557.1 putative spermidine/putrescine transport system permease protein [Halohasta litchfieldiae]SEJ22473.1 putative spermidine/putrescine transport system permease protein [Halohasta litchfieldiae]
MASSIPRSSLSARFGRTFIKIVLVTTLVFLSLPVVLTFISSFAAEWIGPLPSGFLTFGNWNDVITGTDVGADVSVGSSLLYSAGLALGGVIINICVGVPIAYAIARYDFWGRDWVNVFAILPLAPGIILGIAFLRTYPDLSTSGIALVIGYSLLKSPYMVMAVQSSFQSMDLQQIEESSRSLGASWIRTFLTVIVPNAKEGIIAGSIISWTLAAAEFNFSYIVYSRGTPPLSIFLYNNITNASFLNAAAAVSVFFLLIALVTIALQIVGNQAAIRRL